MTSSPYLINNTEPEKESTQEVSEETKLLFFAKTEQLCSEVEKWLKRRERKINVRSDISRSEACRADL